MAVKRKRRRKAHYPVRHMGSGGWDHYQKGFTPARQRALKKAQAVSAAKRRVSGGRVAGNSAEKTVGSMPKPKAKKPSKALANVASSAPQINSANHPKPLFGANIPVGLGVRVKPGVDIGLRRVGVNVEVSRNIGAGYSAVTFHSIGVKRTEPTWIEKIVHKNKRAVGGWVAKRIAGTNAHPAFKTAGIDVTKNILGLNDNIRLGSRVRLERSGGKYTARSSRNAMPLDFKPGFRAYGQQRISGSPDRKKGQVRLQRRNVANGPSHRRVKAVAQRKVIAQKPHKAIGQAKMKNGAKKRTTKSYAGKKTGKR